jgi:hypothetical protein
MLRNQYFKRCRVPSQTKYNFTLTYSNSVATLTLSPSRVACGDIFHLIVIDTDLAVKFSSVPTETKYSMFGLYGSVA